MRITKKSVYQWLRSRLKRDLQWAQTCLAIAYNNQDAVEKVDGESYYINCRGLTRYDSGRVKELVTKLLSKQPLDTGDRRSILAIAPRYHRQFIDHFGWPDMKRVFLEENGQLSLNLD